jgi:small subunit ribosomal protein S20
MANTKSAKKQAKQNEKHRVRNLARRTAVKTAIKKVLSAVEEKSSADKVQTLFKDAAAKLARAKSKGVMHKNTASRKLSRLAKRAQQAPSAEAAAQK